MQEELISKKDLLELKGITYGQLYRWKRKNLIPDDWFVRRSTFTGQETFFPREKILQRIDSILNMKDEHSLNDLAGVFSPGAAMPTVSEKKSVLVERGIVSKHAMDIFTSAAGGGDILDFNSILFVYIAEKLLASGEAGVDEIKQAIAVMAENYTSFTGKNCELVMLRKLGVTISALSGVPGDVYFEKNVKVITRLSMQACLEELKLKL
jgi:hypothetical protein